MNIFCWLEHILPLKKYDHTTWIRAQLCWRKYTSFCREPTCENAETCSLKYAVEWVFYLPLEQVAPLFQDLLGLEHVHVSKPSLDS